MTFLSMFFVSDFHSANLEVSGFGQSRKPKVIESSNFEIHVKRAFIPYESAHVAVDLEIPWAFSANFRTTLNLCVSAGQVL